MAGSFPKILPAFFAMTIDRRYAGLRNAKARIEAIYRSFVALVLVALQLSCLDRSKRALQSYSKPNGAIWEGMQDYWRRYGPIHENNKYYRTFRLEKAAFYTFFARIRCQFFES